MQAMQSSVEPARLQAALDGGALLQQRPHAHKVRAPRAQQLRLLLVREAQRQLRARMLPHRVLFFTTTTTLR